MKVFAWSWPHSTYTRAWSFLIEKRLIWKIGVLRDGATRSNMEIPVQSKESLKMKVPPLERHETERSSLCVVLPQWRVTFSTTAYSAIIKYLFIVTLVGSLVNDSSACVCVCVCVCVKIYSHCVDQRPESTLFAFSALFYCVLEPKILQVNFCY